MSLCSPACTGPGCLPDLWAVQIYGFRQTLFEEHCGGLHESFGDPGTQECMQEVQRRARASWQAFTAPEIQELPCHLMPYPFQVSPSCGHPPFVHSLPYDPCCPTEIARLACMLASLQLASLVGHKVAEVLI